MKTAFTSKTMWAGFSVTLLSVLAMVAEFWSLLNFDQIEILNQLFGPELVAVIGAVMIALRVVTSSPLVWDKGPLEDIPDEGDVR